MPDKLQGDIFKILLFISYIHRLDRNITFDALS